MISLLVVVCGACGDASNDPADSGDGDARVETRVIDCGGSACGALVLEDDAPAEVVPPTPRISGYADPSIRLEPGSSRLWMAYSWPYFEGDAVRVENHLARSDDAGTTWQFVRRLWLSHDEVDPAGIHGSGYANNETVSLAPRATTDGTLWYYARMRYFTRPVDGYQFVSFHTRVGVVNDIATLSDAPESAEAVLGGALTPAAWDIDVRLSSLSPELAGCTFFDAGVIWADGRLRMAVQCMRFDDAGIEQPEEGAVVMVSTDAAGATPHGWSWTYDGVLATHDDALALGGETLLQNELALARDGTPLLITSPSFSGGVIADHAGCRVIEMTSMADGALRRQRDGALAVRLSLDDVVGTGACTYEPASETGVVMMRRQFQQSPALLIGTLLQSLAHP
jgi:hypothetical protein